MGTTAAFAFVSARFASSSSVIASASELSSADNGGARRLIRYHPLTGSESRQ